jgi:uncharacterized protein (TIGR03083 family)
MLDYTRSIRSDGAAFAAVIRAEALGTPVPSCPGWTLRDLAEHLGHVHRWARIAAATAAPPDPSLIDRAPEPTDSAGDGDALADWLLVGVDGLAATLAGLPADAPTWHPFPAPLLAGVWPRRQAHELAVHRWDAEAAVGPARPLDAALAADFVREFFEVIVPRVMDRDARTAPEGETAITLADTGTRFVVRSTPGSVDLATAATDHTPVISGTAQDVLLALWRRAPLPGPAPAGVAAAWLRFGGN